MNTTQKVLIWLCERIKWLNSRQCIGIESKIFEIDQSAEGIRDHSYSIMYKIESDQVARCGQLMENMSRYHGIEYHDRWSKN